ncbi:hypothetical protein NRIC_33160 [Enterococcus florum]|uniref:Uncharacterized protein n=1 Tax=Enterococcus florum TaxID=2480627 RepID=A0A4P5PB82_9ENTE|nr:hypothetical protein [Enterococcus florum]GCF95425.1 hypothetical protein NRIC_33160 [Enterococcus florum]
MNNPYEEKIQQLRNGDISEFTVTRDDFFLFREVWLKQEDRKCFRGIAGHDGVIVYVYDTNMV